MNSRSQPQRFVSLGKHKILIVAFPEDQLFDLLPKKWTGLSCF
jgi:hypothetical protein